MDVEARKTEAAALYQEIITRAICGTGEKSFRYVKRLSLPEGKTLTSVLGASLTRVTLPEVAEVTVPNRRPMQVPASGSFHVHVWYSYNGNDETAVMKETIRVTEMIPVALTSAVAADEVLARISVSGAPRCVEAVPEGANGVRVTIEFGLSAEVIGDTKICVRVYSRPE